MALSKLKGTPIDRQSKEIIFNVFQYCGKEKRNIAMTEENAGSYCMVHPSRLYERVSRMTGVSERTIRNIVKEKDSGAFRSPLNLPLGLDES